MENQDRLKIMVFKYLDGLFEDIHIQETEDWINGQVGNIFLFIHYSDSNRIYLDDNTSKLIHNMFNIDYGKVSNYVKEYLSINVKSSLITASVYLTI
jgi:hypothetical protein